MLLIINNFLQIFSHDLQIRNADIEVGVGTSKPNESNVCNNKITQISLKSSLRTEKAPSKNGKRVKFSYLITGQIPNTFNLKNERNSRSFELALTASKQQLSQLSY